jgi:hypothetical protein
MSDITFAELEQGVARTADRIGSMNSVGLLRGLEKLILVLEHFLTAQFGTDDTPLSVQQAVLLFNQLLVRLGERFTQLDGTFTTEEDRDLRILAERISILFEQMVVRVFKFVEAFSKFEELQFGSIN